MNRENPQNLKCRFFLWISFTEGRGARLRWEQSKPEGHKGPRGRSRLLSLCRINLQSLQRLHVGSNFILILSEAKSSSDVWCPLLELGEPEEPSTVRPAA